MVDFSKRNNLISNNTAKKKLQTREQMVRITSGAITNATILYRAGCYVMVHWLSAGLL